MQNLNAGSLACLINKKKFIVNEIRVDSSNDSFGCISAVRLAPKTVTVQATDADSMLSVTISGPRDRVESLIPLVQDQNWNGKGEPLPGQMVKTESGTQAEVVMVGEFTTSFPTRRAILKVGDLFIPHAHAISSLSAPERILTGQEKKQIEAIRCLVAAEIIGFSFGEDEIKKIKEGTKS